jgi:hypothetical protein
MKTNTIEIEFDGPLNQQVLFQPLGRAMRGRFDTRRMANAGKLFHQWPESIPGQRLQLDVTTGAAEIIEPLYLAEFAPIRERIEQRGWKLPPERETVQAHVPTWLHWLKGLIDAGKAKLLSGTLPDKIDGKPQLRFHSTEQPEPIDKLTVAITEQNTLLAKLLSTLANKE